MNSHNDPVGAVPDGATRTEHQLGGDGKGLDSAPRRIGVAAAIVLVWSLGALAADCRADARAVRATPAQATNEAQKKLEESQRAARKKAEDLERARLRKLAEKQKLEAEKNKSEKKADGAGGKTKRKEN
jgi:hypothetical protein